MCVGPSDWSSMKMCAPGKSAGSGSSSSSGSPPPTETTSGVSGMGDDDRGGNATVAGASSPATASPIASTRGSRSALAADRGMKGSGATGGDHAVAEKDSGTIGGNHGGEELGGEVLDAASAAGMWC